MTEIINPVRAKSAYVEVERTDKAGRKPRKVKQHIVIDAGAHSGKEMEKVARQLAEDTGVPESQVKIETYAKGESPLEVNPVHRGGPTRWERPRQQQEVKRREFQRTRNVFAFEWNPLTATPEEIAAYVAAFEANRSKSP